MTTLRKPITITSTLKLIKIPVTTIVIDMLVSKSLGHALKDNPFVYSEH